MRNLPFYWTAILSVIILSIILTTLRVHVSLQRHLLSSHDFHLQSDQDKNEIYHQLELPVHFSRWMQHDRFLREWIENGEEDPQVIYDYLEHATEGYGYKSYFASNQTRNYYFSDGTSFKIERDTPDVEWFFFLVETETPELTDVGYHSGDPNQPFLYIDLEIRSSRDEILGYVGAAVELDRFLNLLERHKERFDQDLHFVNQKGMVILSSKREMVNTEARQYPWYPDLLNNTEVQADWALLPVDGNPAHPEADTFPATFQSLDELGWLLVVENDHLESQVSIGRIVWQTIGYLLIMVLVVGAFLAYLFRRFKKDLDQAFHEIHTLKGILPICSSCKKIRDDDGYWQEVESYVKAHSDASFTHSICRECAERIYPYLDFEEIDRRSAEPD